MKALSIWPEYAMEIAEGKKTEEYRSWTTQYRGPLLICSTQAHGVPGSIPGHAICVVDLVDIRKDGEKDYAWILDNVRLIKPTPVKGKLSLFEVDIDPEYAPEDNSEKEEWLDNYFNPKKLADSSRRKRQADTIIEVEEEDDDYELSENAKRTMRILFGDQFKET